MSFSASLVDGFTADAASVDRSNIVEGKPNSLEIPADGEVEADAHQRIATLLANDDFRRAILWQNRSAAHIVESRMASVRQASPTKEVRRSAELVARYAQRFCFKADTIGFFGPLAWARLGAEHALMRLSLGEQLLKTTEVFFETWAIDALASQLALIPSVRRQLLPRLLPNACCSRGFLHFPRSAPLRLSVREAKLLELCDGTTSAERIAEKLPITQWALFGSKEEVFDALDELERRGLLRCGFPPCDTRAPVQSLAVMLRALRPSPECDDTIALLNNLAQHGDAIKRAQETGEPSDLDQALENLNDCYSRASSLPASRRPGEDYAGRALVYLECERDVECSLGYQFLSAIAEPLTLVLQGARWLRSRAAEVYERRLEALYEDLRDESDDVEFSHAWFALQTELFGKSGRPIDEVLLQFTSRWRDLLGLDGRGDSPLHYTSSGLKDAVHASFRLQHNSAWPTARWHSPDLQIAAKSSDAIINGEYEVVLGELHIAWNTLTTFVSSGAASAELIQLYESGGSALRIPPCLPDWWPRETAYTTDQFARTHPAAFCFSEKPLSPAVDSVSVSALLLRRRGDALELRTRDGAWCGQPQSILGDFYSMTVADAYKTLPTTGFTPRVYIDRLIVLRASWVLPATDLGFVWEKNRELLFARARSWARGIGMPRNVFYKLPGELKPIYCDFDSYLLSAILAKGVRKSIEQEPDVPIVFTEMYPSPDLVWLGDSKDGRYVSEFRFVVADDLV